MRCRNVRRQVRQEVYLQERSRLQPGRRFVYLCSRLDGNQLQHTWVEAATAAKNRCEELFKAVFNVASRDWAWFISSLVSLSKATIFSYEHLVHQTNGEAQTSGRQSVLVTSAEHSINHCYKAWVESWTWVKKEQPDPDEAWLQSDNSIGTINQALQVDPKQIVSVAFFPGCGAHQWGAGCTQTCACQHGKCNPVDGSCSCDPGYTVSEMSHIKFTKQNYPDPFLTLRLCSLLIFQFTFCGNFVLLKS